MKVRTGRVGESAPDWNKPWPVKSTKYADLVPASTPIVWVNETGLPDIAVESLAPFTDPLLAAFDQGLREHDSKFPKDILELLGPKLNGDSLRNLGLDPNPRFVVYMLGPSTVFRIGLSDPDKLRELLLDSRSEVLNFHGQEFLHFPAEDDVDDDFDVIIAINGTDLVLAGIVPERLEYTLPRVFGQELPVERLWDSGFVARAHQEFGLMPNYLGVLFPATVVKTVRDRAAAPDESSDPVCDDEADRLTEAFPRIYWGIWRFGAESVQSSFVVEMDHEIAASLPTLASSVPGLTERPSATELLAFGLSFDIAAYESVFRDLGKRVSARPFKCEEFKGFNELPQAVAAFALIPPAFRRMSGLAAVANRLEPDMPSGYAVIGVDQPQQALQELTAQLPALDPSRVKPGKVIKVVDAFPSARDNKTAAELKMVAGTRGIAFGTTDIESSSLRAAVSRQSDDNATIAMLRWKIDQAPAMRKMMSELDDQEPLVADLTYAALTALSRGSMILKATSKGLRMDITIRRPQSRASSPAQPSSIVERNTESTPK